MSGKGEKNSRSVLKDWQALHIKCMAKIQKENIKYIQRFYDLPYHTIYMIIHKRYGHLDKIIDEDI